MEWAYLFDKIINQFGMKTGSLINHLIGKSLSWFFMKKIHQIEAYQVQGFLY